MRRSDKVEQSWQGFEFFYPLRVNPRPLQWPLPSKYKYSYRDLYALFESALGGEEL
jgi:hypothetical protein